MQKEAKGQKNNMPLIKLHKQGQVCWKFGKKGHIYCGKNSREKAVKQGRAIEWRKHSKKGKKK